MKTTYMIYLALTMGPVVIGQWIIARKIFVRNWKAILFPTLILGTYLSIADAYSIRCGIWFFDTKQTLGITLGEHLPLEEALFFYITSLLVSQSFVMLLPDKLRR